MRSAVLWAAVAALAGCSSTPATPGGDGMLDQDLSASAVDMINHDLTNGPDLAQPPDLMPPPPPIVGQVTDHYHQPTATDNGTQTDVPRDLSAVSIAAYVSDGAGGFGTYVGTGKADGSFTIPYVPVGATFTVRVGTRYLLPSTNRSPTFGDDLFGRPGAVIATNNVQLVLNVTGLDLVGVLDTVGIFSPTVNASYDDLIYDTNSAPPPPVTSLAAIPFNYRAFEPSPYLYSNDPVFLTQINVTTSASTETRVVTRALGPSTLTVTNASGTGGTLSGAFSVTAQSQSATLDWRRSVFSAAALVSAVNPQGVLSTLDVYVTPQPGGYVRTAPPYAPALLRLHTGPDVNTGPDTSDLKTAALSYGDPFPAAWGQVGVAEASVYVGGLSYAATGVVGKIGYVEDLTTFKANPIKPPLTPVQGLALTTPKGEMPLSAAVTGASLSPTLHWTAPAQGTVDHYLVSIIQRDSTLQKEAQVAQISTTLTQFVVPPAVFQSGKNFSYYLSVRAVQGSGALVTGTPQAWADAISQTIVP